MQVYHSEVGECGTAYLRYHQQPPGARGDVELGKEAFSLWWFIDTVR